MIILKSLRFFSPDGTGGGGNGDGGDGGGNGNGDGGNGDGGQPSISERYKTAKAAIDAGGEGDGGGDKGGDKAGGEGGADKGKGDDKGGDKSGNKSEDKGGEPGSAKEAALGGLAGDPGDKGGTDKDKKADDGAVDMSQFPETLQKGEAKEHWPKARAALESQGKKIGEQSATIANLTRELEQARQTPPEAATQLKELQERLDSYKDAIAAINVEYSPDFRKEFVDGRAELVSKAAAKLNAYGGDGEKLKTALQMPESKARSAAIREAMGEVEGPDAARVLSFVTELDKLDDRKAEMMKDPQGAWDKLQKELKDAAARESAQREQLKKTVFEGATKKLAAEVLLLKPQDAKFPDAKEWNSRIEKITKDAFALLGPDQKPEVLAEKAIWAEAGPHLQQLLTETYKDLREARKALKAFDESEPGFRGGKKKGESGEGETVAQRYQKALAKQQGDED